MAADTPENGASASNPKTTDPLEITRQRILVVEGRDEQNFLESFMEHVSISTIQIMPIGGKTKLRGNLKALTLRSGFSNVEVLGVMRDADSDFEAAFKSVQDSLTNAKLSVPKHPLELAGRNPGVIIMILPGAGKSGMLEDIWLASVARDPAINCVDQYFDCLSQQFVSWPTNISKARIQVFLASKPEHEKLPGLVTWEWDHPAFEPIKDFLQQIASV